MNKLAKPFKAIALFLMPALLWGQNLNIELTSRGEDADFNKMILLTSVFQLKNDSVANPLDAASAKIGDAVEWKKIKAPLMNKKMRPGFAWINGGTNPDPFAKGYTLIVIENPGWTAYPTYIWTDRNYNLDLTDDGPPDTMTAKKPAIIRLNNHATGYQVWLEHFDFIRFPQYRQMHDDAMYKLQGSRQFIGTENCFRERRMNVLAGHWKSASDSFSIAVKDVNCNGIYSDDDLDMIMISDFKGNFQNLQGVTLKEGRAYLEWNGVAYQVTQIDSDGSFIRITRDTSARLRYSLNEGDKIPKFRFCAVGKPSKKMRIRKVRSGLTYVYVWHDLAAQYVKDSADLHALGRKDSSIIKVVALNYGNSATYVYRYNRRNKTTILQGFSSNDINEKLKVQKIPHGILLDRKKRIVRNGISPAEVLIFLNR